MSTLSPLSSAASSVNSQGIVAEAAAARHEDQRGRHALLHGERIVPGYGLERDRREPQSRGRVADEVDAGRIEQGRASALVDCNVEGHAERRANGRDAAKKTIADGLRDRFVLMADFEPDLRFGRHHIGRVWGDLYPRRRGVRAG